MKLELDVASEPFNGGHVVLKLAKSIFSMGREELVELKRVLDSVIAVESKKFSPEGFNILILEKEVHVAAVMLYRRYKKALEKAERKRVYVAEGEVECKGRIEANGELHIKPAVDRVDLTFFANPKYKILVVSEMRRIVVRCSGYEILELEGEEVPLATAKFLVERFYERG